MSAANTNSTFSKEDVASTKTRYAITWNNVLAKQPNSDEDTSNKKIEDEILILDLKKDLGDWWHKCQ